MRKNTTTTTKATAASKSEYRAHAEKTVREIAVLSGIDPDELVRDVLIDDDEQEPETIAVNLPAYAVRLLRGVTVASGISGGEDALMASVIDDLASDTLSGDGARSLILEGWSFTPAEAKAADKRMKSTVARFKSGRA